MSPWTSIILGLWYLDIAQRGYFGCDLLKLDTSSAFAIVLYFLGLFPLVLEYKQVQKYHELQSDWTPRIFA